MKRSFLRAIASLWVLMAVSACAGANTASAPPPPPLSQRQAAGNSVGDAVSRNGGSAIIESTYVSALGQPCRKIQPLGPGQPPLTECFDGQWRIVDEITGLTPVRR